METSPFESFVPRISAAEGDLRSIRSDLRSIRSDLQRAITVAQSTAYAEEAPTPVEQAATIAAFVPEPQEPESTAYADPPTERAGMTSGELEALLAGRWLHLVGLLLVFIGAAFFLKVAFDHDWITPVFRVALGLVVGTATIVYGQRLANKGKRYFSEGITALGAGIEFLSLYASNALFHLASPTLVLVGMVAVSAAIASLAWRRQSERLGILAAIGGFLAPMLAGTQSADQLLLAGYIGVLDIGLLLLAELIDSRIIGPIALGGSIFYALSSFSFAHTIDDVQRAGIYLSLYLTFAGVGWIVTKVRGTLDPFRSVVGGVALGTLLLGLETALLSEHRTLLAAILLGLSIAHLCAAALLKSRYQSWLATAALTLAIPAAFDRPIFVNVAWAAEAAVLAIAGLRFRDDVLKVMGLGLLALDVARDAFLYVDYVSTHPIFNARFGSLTAAIVAVWAAVRAIDGSGAAEYDAVLVRTLRTVGHAIALFALSAEAWDSVAHFGGTAQGSNAALSIVWAIFAATLIGYGLRKRDSFMRWEGLALIVVTAGKVLFFDLSFLDLGYRVLSAVLVGVALIGVSYAYQRRLPSERQL